MGKGTYQGGGTVLNGGSDWFTRDVDLSDPVERRKLPLTAVAAEDAANAEHRRAEVEAAQKRDQVRTFSQTELKTKALDARFAEIARGLAASNKKD